MKYAICAIILGLMNALAIFISTEESNGWVVNGLAAFIMMISMLGFITFLIVGIWHMLLFVGSSILPIFWYKKYRRIQ